MSRPSATLRQMDVGMYSRGWTFMQDKNKMFLIQREQQWKAAEGK